MSTIFLSLANGKAIPYGVYDILQNTGFVNVGRDHDTAAFAVESIRRWWQHGQAGYPGARELLIFADGGGSNSMCGRLWKREQQRLANETGLTLRVCHHPPCTSTWNTIEHKLFSYISIKWAAASVVKNPLSIVALSGNS